MRTTNFTPVDTELVTKFISSIGLGDERHSLAKIEIDVFFGIHTLDFNQTDTIVLITQSTLVSKDSTINM
jgi:hypothetical protein